MRFSSFRGGERGVALGLALLSLVVIGTLVAGVFFMSMQEYRTGRNKLTQPSALAAAEYGHDTLFTGWSTSWNGLKQGDTVVRVFGGSGWSDTVRLTKLNQHMFYLVSLGRSANAAGGEGRRRTGFLLQLRYPEFKIKGALTTYSGPGQDYQGQNQTHNGNDQVPPGWTDCDTPGEAVAGIAMNKNPVLQTSTVLGDPPVAVSPAMSDTNTYFNYGSLTWNDLVAMRTKTLGAQYDGAGPSITGGTCNTAVGSNFGEPDHTTPAGPCDNYYPIAYRNGDLQMQNSQGQGILLVTGDLQFQDTRWYGLIIVRGRFQTQDQSLPGTTVQGALLAANRLNNSTQSQGGKHLYSSCAILKAAQQLAVIRRVEERAWADLN